MVPLFHFSTMISTIHSSVTRRLVLDRHAPIPRRRLVLDRRDSSLLRCRLVLDRRDTTILRCRLVRDRRDALLLRRRLVLDRRDEPFFRRRLVIDRCASSSSCRLVIDRRVLFDESSTLTQHQPSILLSEYPIRHYIPSSFQRIRRGIG